MPIVQQECNRAPQTAQKPSEFPLLPFRHARLEVVRKRRWESRARDFGGESAFETTTTLIVFEESSVVNF